MITHNTSPILTAHSTVFKLPQSQVFEDNESCQKFAMMSKISSRIKPKKTRKSILILFYKMTINNGTKKIEARIKHIAIHYHFFRTKVADLDIKVVSIGTDDQLRYRFIKGLPVYKFIKFRKILMGW